MDYFHLFCRLFTWMSLRQEWIHIPDDICGMSWRRRKRTGWSFWQLILWMKQTYWQVRLYSHLGGGDNFVCQGGLRHIFTILKTRFSSGEWGFRLLRSAHNVNYWSIQWHVFIYCFSMTSPVYMYVFLLNYVTISISLFFWQTEKHLSVRESFGAVVPPCFWRADLE